MRIIASFPTHGNGHAKSALGKVEPAHEISVLHDLVDSENNQDRFRGLPKTARAAQKNQLRADTLLMEEGGSVGHTHSSSFSPLHRATLRTA